MLIQLLDGKSDSGDILKMRCAVVRWWQHTTCQINAL